MGVANSGSVGRGRLTKADILKGPQPTTETIIAELRAEVNRQDRKVLDMQLEIDALTSELEYVTMTDDDSEPYKGPLVYR